MRSDISETERTLPRRNDGDPKCGNPWCETVVAIRGEFCTPCRKQQDRHREAMRQFRERQAS